MGYFAIFTYEDGKISITFPDLPGCTSCANTEEEAMKNAQEAMCGHLFFIEQDGDALPAPSSLENLKAEKNEKIVMIRM